MRFHCERADETTPKTLSKLCSTSGEEEINNLAAPSSTVKMTPLPTSAITAYILAGGRSSRMGRDKAMLQLAGKTLLARAVEIARTVATEVVLLGDRQDLQGADRAIPDLHPGCGPVGGMETALRDLASRPSDSQKAERACFLPVDMPFLPAGLYAALMRDWLAEGTLSPTQPSTTARSL